MRPIIELEWTAFSGFLRFSFSFTFCLSSFWPVNEAPVEFTKWRDDLCTGGRGKEEYEEERRQQQQRPSGRCSRFWSTHSNLYNHSKLRHIAMWIEIWPVHWMAPLSSDFRYYCLMFLQHRQHQSKSVRRSMVLPSNHCSFQSSVCSSPCLFT